MKLKKLTIFGFKSFADKISLDFDCEILGIVGPNGCGKSNIVDAFRWVIGEAHAKSFRADKMQDVLFAGNEKRKPANLAEVTIVLSDIDDELNLPYEEIAITRRLYRDGDSEYFLNKEPVRLKDIQDLFLGSGIGKNAFSVFEQGKLDSVIHLHPLQRRAIFDEAAGIGRFLQRKKETQKRLSFANENYQRVKDIHVEVEKKAKALKKQSLQAKAFQDNKDALKDLEKNVLITKWRAISEKKHALFQKLESLKKQLQEKKGKIIGLEEEMEGHKHKAAEIEGQLKTLQKSLFERKTSLEIEKVKFQEKKGMLIDGEKKEKAFIRDKEELAKKRKIELEKISEKQKTLSFLLEKSSDLEKEVLKRKEVKENLEQETILLRDNLRKLSHKYMKAIDEEKKSHGALQKKLIQIEAQKERSTKLSQIIVEKNNKIEGFEKDSALKKKEVNSLSKEIDALKNEIQKLEKELKTDNRLIEEKKEDKAKLFSKIESVRAKEEALIRLKEQFEGFSLGAKRLLQEASNAKSIFYKKIHPLIEHFSSKKKGESLSASLFMYADTLVVEDKKTLSEVLAFAHEKKLSNFSIFALSQLTKKTSVLDHFLESIEFCDDPASAVKNKEQVSKDGNFYVTRHGVIFSIGANKDVFQREIEIQNLSSQKEKLKEELKLLDEHLKGELEKSKEKENAFRTLSLQHRKKEMSLVQENFAYQRMVADLAKEKKEKGELENEKDSLQDEKEEEELLHLKKSLDEKQKEVALLAEEEAEKEKLLKGFESKSKEATFHFEKGQKEYQTAFSEKQKIENELFVLNSKEKHIQDESAKKEKELHLIKKAMEEAEEFIAHAESQIDEKENELKQQETTLKKWELDHKEIKSISDKTNKHLQIANSEVREIEKESYKIEIWDAEEGSKQRHFEEELYTRHEISKESISSIPVVLEEGLEEAEKRIYDLRSSLEKTPGINLAAIEEYKAEEERFQFLTNQLNDLESAKTDLEEVIAKLDAESRKVFKKTYEKIKANFQKNFALLFNGGEADLKFTESGDVLEAGIEIIAKPPGKQMRSITLLSGGEKCLTALALLFSIFEVKPAPFCILDEVDAPLDDSNVERFSKMLKQYTQETQFILVTHNKKTMAFADVLIGISMEEKGVSKLISLAFEKRFALQN